MKRNSTIIRFMALLLANVMLLSLCPIAYAADDTLRIGSLNELQNFAKRCSSDKYSKNLTVILTQDIDLKESELSIPIFLGTFDGNGHKITGLKIISENSRSALFGRIEKGAVVRKLQLEGDVSPTGEQNYIGGFAGENYGTIENCSFSGVISGSEQVGGIAGINKSSGVITGCSVSGVIIGKKFIGGIVGENSGSIVNSSNKAAVNTTITDENITLSELTELDSVIYDLLKNKNLDHEIPVTTDTGGIAGYSTGVIQSCENSGAVGYSHVGYNVGGIVGRQSGYISNCQNHGKILGRKDVGGIVGQMTPNITLQVSNNSLDELQNELNKLHSLIDRTLSDAESTSNSVSEHLNQVLSYTDNARSSANNMTDQLGSFVDSNIESVNGLSLMIERYLSKLSPITSDIANTSSGLTDTISEIRKLFDMLDGTTEYNEQILRELQNFCTETSQTAKDLSDGLDAFNRAIDLLKNESAKPDTTQLSADIAMLKESSDKLKTTINQAIKELKDNGTITKETSLALANGFRTVLDYNVAVGRDFTDVLKNTDFSAIRNQKLQTLRKFANEMQTSITCFSSSSSHFSKAMDALGKGIGSLRDLNTKLSKVSKQFDAVLESVQETSTSLKSALKKASQLVDEFSREEPITFTPLGSEFTNSSDALNTALSGIGNELSELNTSISSSSTALLSDVRAINTQFMKVMNLFLNLINETKNIDYTDIFEDVSEDSIQSAVRGKVQESNNDGEISADRNVGGVVGSMAIEYDLDPEDDLSLNNWSGKFTYQSRAILLNCKNTGNITAKRSCVGSVVGRMDIGTIYGCGGFGDVTSNSGDYVGGVCGFSLSSVKNSFTKCTLSGKKYVGGIVGSGKRVIDCVSMIEISSDSSFCGAITGEITGEYKGNLFVSEYLAGIDRISYAKKAESISYLELLKINGLPDEMKQLTLRFVADGKELKTLSFNYGDSFSMDVAPKIPKKDGNYAVWSRTELSELHFDTIVNAEYIPYVTTVAGNAKRKDGRTVFFVEGNFDEKATMSTEKCVVQDSEIPLNKWWQSRELLESWTLKLSKDNKTMHKIHYLAPDGNIDGVCIFVKQNGEWKRVESSEFGSYLVAELDGEKIEIAIVREQTLWWILFIPVLILIVVVLCIIGLILYKKKHKM